MSTRSFVVIFVCFFLSLGTRASDSSFFPFFDLTFLEAPHGPLDPRSTQCDTLLRSTIRDFRFSDQKLEFTGDGILARRHRVIYDLVRRIRWIFGQETTFPEALWTPVTPENRRELKVGVENASYNRFLDIILQNWMDVLLGEFHSNDPETYFPSRKNHLKQAHFQEASPHGILIATPLHGESEQKAMIQMLREDSTYHQMGRILILDPDKPSVRPNEQFLNEATRVLIGQTSAHEPYELISLLPAFDGVKKVFLTGASPGRYLFSPDVPLEPYEVNNQLRVLLGSAHTLEIHLPILFSYVYLPVETFTGGSPKIISPKQFRFSPSNVREFQELNIALAIHAIQEFRDSDTETLNKFLSQFALEIFPFLKGSSVTWNNEEMITVEGTVLVDGEQKTLKVVFQV